MPTSPGAAIYGTLTVGALLAAESVQRETFGETVAAVALALLVYWLAHSYSDYAAHRLRQSEPLELSALLRTMVHELSILFGAAVPLLALLLCWAVGASLGTAVGVAVWASAGMILIIEVVAGVRAEQSGRDLVLQSALGAVLGFLIIALRLLLH